MRLWHQSLIPHLPRQQLLGQHRECCALRGKGWGRKHSVVNYVFEHPVEWLVVYHHLIMDEMERRGYHPNKVWDNPNWRGSTLGEQADWANHHIVNDIYTMMQPKGILYPEHNDEYLKECLENLKEKGIDLYEALD